MPGGRLPGRGACLDHGGKSARRERPARLAASTHSTSRARGGRRRQPPRLGPPRPPRCPRSARRTGRSSAAGRRAEQLLEWARGHGSASSTSRACTRAAGRSACSSTGQAPPGSDRRRRRWRSRRRRRRQVALKREIRHRWPLFTFAPGRIPLLPKAIGSHLGYHRAGRRVRAGRPRLPRCRLARVRPDLRASPGSHGPGHRPCARVLGLPAGRRSGEVLRELDGSTERASWRLETGRNLGALRPARAHP